jgi:tRNA pseudouridine38-40 synthase
MRCMPVHSLVRERRWALQIAYDGGDFHGFQALPGLRTVQGELTAALQRVLGPIGALACAGRTDAGVHAYGQIVSFTAETRLPPGRLQYVLQQQLPADIALRGLWTIPETFHARFSARARHYRYQLQINQAADPFLQRYSWQYPHPIAPEKLEAAWQQTIGLYDFKPFARSGSTRKQTRIQVWVAEMRIQQAQITLDIVADSFLYSMVRNLVGTALDMARGRLPLDTIREVLRQADKRPLGVTAPPQGLYLCRALYDPSFGIQAGYPELLNASTEALIPSEALLDPGKWWN